MGQHAESPQWQLPLRDVALLRLKAKTDREQTRMSPAGAAFSAVRDLRRIRKCRLQLRRPAIARSGRGKRSTLCALRQERRNQHFVTAGTNLVYAG
jgi:hypothetical protein